MRKLGVAGSYGTGLESVPTKWQSAVQVQVVLDRALIEEGVDTNAVPTVSPYIHRYAVLFPGCGVLSFSTPPFIIF